jgi:hypothetical protein
MRGTMMPCVCSCIALACAQVRRRAPSSSASSVIAAARELLPTRRLSSQRLTLEHDDTSRNLSATGANSRCRRRYRKTSTARIKICTHDPRAPVEPAGTAHHRMSRRRSNGPATVSAATHSACSHRRTGTRQSAFSRTSGDRIRGT